MRTQTSIEVAFRFARLTLHLNLATGVPQRDRGLSLIPISHTHSPLHVYGANRRLTSNCGCGKAFRHFATVEPLLGVTAGPSSQKGHSCQCSGLRCSPCHAQFLLFRSFHQISPSDSACPHWFYRSTVLVLFMFLFSCPRMDTLAGGFLLPHRRYKMDN
ncbi:MAG: hypothetical protein JOS17DRAFT_477402 [Linnemannia elongata]|nr:MAG: hypothetical protein JOS17DRAFT_477402 [Linnemannia elongata]